MSRLALAERVGASPASVWNWESGTMPRRGALQKIASALSVSEEYLRTGDQKAARAGAQQSAPQASASVAGILHRARSELAKASGLAPEQIKLSLQFALE